MTQTITTKSEVVEPKEEEVRAQLSKILDDADFKQSPKISRFLEYVVEATLNGKQQYLKGHTIAIEVFDKDQSFDPQIDPLVRVNAVRLRRMLRQYNTTRGLNDSVIIDIIKGSYVPQFYYQTNKDKIIDQPPTLSKDCSFPSIAVLNFKILNKEFSYEYFADGITQEIISQLCKFKEFVVIARSSININEEKNINSKQLLVFSDVRYLLSGSVRIENGKVRINVELDDTSTHAIVWAQEYYKDLSTRNLISIEDEIAIQVAITIAQPYGVIIRKELAKLDRTSANDLTAYQHYLNFYKWAITLSPRDHLKARDALEKAVKIDPNFSDAWAALAIIYNSEYMFSYNVIKRDQDVRELAFQTAQKAIKADPDNARAHYAKVFANMAKFGTRPYIDKAEEIYQRYPYKPLLVAVYGLRLALCGEWEHGLKLIKHAMVLNPAHPDFYHIPFILNCYRQDMFPEALYEARKVNLPGYFWANLTLAALYADAGEEKQASIAANQALTLYPNFEQQACFEIEKYGVQTELKEKLLKGFRKAVLLIK